MQSLRLGLVATALSLLCRIAQAGGPNSLTAITRFPYQDTTRSYSEAFPIALSGQTLLMVWADNVEILSSRSSDGGVTWAAPVQVATRAGSAGSLTGIRTSSGRLMIFWRDSLGIRGLSSADGGITWSVPMTVAPVIAASVQVSQTEDNKLWLAWCLPLGMVNRYVTSTDDGTTWSAAQTIPGPQKYDMCFVTGEGGALHCIYSTGYDIERITSTNSGNTWSPAVPILNTSFAERRPRIARQSDGTILLVFDTQGDSIHTAFDVKYVTSMNGGSTWSSPVAFTRFVGTDDMNSVTILNDEPFVTFMSNRGIAGLPSYQTLHIWYGIIGVTPDDNPPPLFLSGGPFHQYAGRENWIQATVDDETGISNVTASYTVNGVNYPPIPLYDDGMHFDGSPGDNLWGNSVSPFPLDSIRCYFTVTDVGGNTLNNCLGSSFRSLPPPVFSGVIQGVSMQVAFDRQAALGKCVLPLGDPGFGLRYPIGSTNEHLWGAGIWVGGMVDTGSVPGVRPRIKAVSTGYEGWSGPYYEFFPGTAPADTIWRVYGQHAPKPAGWDQYWGSALPYHPFADQNFYNQYNDYTQPVNNHVPMGINVIQSSYTWDDGLGDGIQILEFRIMNNSTRTIDSAYIGLFTDCDIGPIDVSTYLYHNCSGYYSPLRMAYTQNPVDFGSTPAGASILATDRPTDSLRVAFQWYPGPYSPPHDAERYNLMSAGLIEADQCPATAESRFVLSFGPFTIQPHTASRPDTLRVAFALLAGVDLNSLEQHASSARVLYHIISDVGQGSGVAPDRFALEQNYPNPFNPTTEMRFQVAEGGLVSLKVYDVLGREVTTLVNEVKRPGSYGVSWNASGVASGVYFCRMQAGGFEQTRKLMVLR